MTEEKAARSDPHGYARLYRSLVFIAEECRMAGMDQHSERIYRASRFFGVGSPSEYLGEALNALGELVADPVGLAPSVVGFSAGLVSEIREGFDRVGGG